MLVIHTGNGRLFTPWKLGYCKEQMSDPHMWYFPNRSSALFNPLVKLRHWPDTSCKLFFVFMTEFTVSHIINTDTIKILEVMMIFLMTLQYPRPFNSVEKGNNFLPYHHLTPTWTSLWIIIQGNCPECKTSNSKFLF